MYNSLLMCEKFENTYIYIILGILNQSLTLYVICYYKVMIRNTNYSRDGPVECINVHTIYAHMERLISS